MEQSAREDNQEEAYGEDLVERLVRGSGVRLQINMRDQTHKGERYDGFEAGCHFESCCCYSCDVLFCFPTALIISRLASLAVTFRFEADNLVPSGVAQIRLFNYNS